MIRYRPLTLAPSLIVICMVMLLLLPPLANSQVINVRTVPLLSCDQFSLVPSVRNSMGGVEIAVDDELADGFVNPARIRRLRKGFVFGSPILNTWAFEQDQSDYFLVENPPQIQGGTDLEMDVASVLSLPLGVVCREKRATVGVAAGLQYLHTRGRRAWRWMPPNQQGSSESKFNAWNVPISIVFGTDLGKTNFKWGAGFCHVLIRGIDGVGLLYPGYSDLEQDGSLFDYRIGLVGSFSESDEISLLGMRHTFSVEQKATYVDPYAVVKNIDKNNGWLARVEYRRVLSENIRVGLQVTGNWKKHPKIPNYPLSGIPRDPGTTKAFDLGIGFAWKNSTTLIACDAIYEPIDTKTWVEAEQDMQTPDGRLIRQGGITMRNDYTFGNRILRFGMETEMTKWLRVRAGAQTKFYQYDYHREDVVAQTKRSATPQSTWTEESITAGATISLGNVECLYTMRIVTGQGLVSSSMPPWFGIDDARAIGADFLIPPSGWMRVRPVPVFAHQLTLVYRLSE